MIKNFKIFPLLGLLYCFPFTSYAINCTVHKVTNIGGTNIHSCIKVTTGSVLVELLTETNPGPVTLTISPITSFPSLIGEALISCKNPGSKGRIKLGFNLVSIPATLTSLQNVGSTTIDRANNPEAFPADLDSDIQFLTTLRVTPTATQLGQLKAFCPGGLNGNMTVVDYVPAAFTGSLSTTAGFQIDLNKTGGACSVPLGNLAIDPTTGNFIKLPYGGGCDPIAGNEIDPVPPPECHEGEHIDYHDNECHDD